LTPKAKNPGGEIPPYSPMDESKVQSQLNNFKTDSDELEEVLDRYDLDAALEQEFNAIDKQFQQLEIIYRSLLNSRRFLSNG